MAITIIVKDGKPRGETRSNIDQKLVDVGWGSSFHSEEDSDKCKFAERQLKKKLGADDAIVPAAVYKQMGKTRK